MEGLKTKETRSTQNKLSLWFLNLLPNQAWAVELAYQAWFGRTFKNHWLSTRFNQDGKLGTTMDISNRLVHLNRFVTRVSGS